jgi:hypothetical protein
MVFVLGGTTACAPRPVAILPPGEVADLDRVRISACCGLKGVALASTGANYIFMQRV